MIYFHALGSAWQKWDSQELQSKLRAIVFHRPQNSIKIAGKNSYTVWEVQCKLIIEANV